MWTVSTWPDSQRNFHTSLPSAVGEPVDVYVNDRHVARGEVLVVDDHFCVRVTEILPVPDETLPSSDC